MKYYFVLLFTLMFASAVPAVAAGGHGPVPAYPELEDGSTQYAAFPKPREMYKETEGGLMDTIKARAVEDPFNIAATVIFLLAICHTFAAGSLNKLAHKYEHIHQEKLRIHGPKDAEHPNGEPEVSFRATLFHFLGEVEAIFGIWVIALAAAATYFYSWLDFEVYLNKDKIFTEPLFVVVIMAIAASRPVLRFAESLMAKAAAIGKGTPAAWWMSVLIIAPILGSFITEPAAMTIGAMLLAKKFYRLKPGKVLAYATLGLLFVNISVGGTLTHFAAPPVLMVAGTWNWGTLFMMEHFGWKAVVGVIISTSIYFVFFRKALFRVADKADGREDGELHPESWEERETPIPVWITVVHLAFVAWTVYTAHYPVLFVGGFLFFLAFLMATRHHQNEVSLKSPLLVGFFLAGLVIHGGVQGWWIAPIIQTLPDQALMLGATILTAFNDNAAITYLASQVDGISFSAKHAVVAGAVAGGGLTVIANAPNPAGQSILSKYFIGGISPLFLFLGALIPTVIVYFCFVLLPNGPAKAGAEPDGQHGEAVPGAGD
ncbi:MAG: putative Na+/H+ antiporter [Akkermansiaceae bacterium]|nr:putative Na+/H+ antiporter [Akkermansiaceae bacterium]